MKRTQNISNQTNETEQLSTALQKLREEVQSLRVPDGYFDSLNLRLVYRIQEQENKSLSKNLIVSFRKPLIWAPAFATVVVAVLLIYVIPSKKESTTQVVDEWTEINMAYDASYAEEALLAESNTIDREIESSVISNNGSVPLLQKEPTDEEITDYLKEHESDNDILNEY
jgi:hypothetical protein